MTMPRAEVVYLLRAFETSGSAFRQTLGFTEERAHSVHTKLVNDAATGCLVCSLRDQLRESHERSAIGLEELRQLKETNLSLRDKLSQIESEMLKLKAVEAHAGP